MMVHVYILLLQCTCSLQPHFCFGRYRIKAMDCRMDNFLPILLHCDKNWTPRTLARVRRTGSQKGQFQHTKMTFVFALSPSQYDSSRARRAQPTIGPRSGNKCEFEALGGYFVYRKKPAVEAGRFG